MEIGFLMGDGIVPSDKASALLKKYISWWFYPGHKTHTAVVDIYEV